MEIISEEERERAIKRLIQLMIEGYTSYDAYIIFLEEPFRDQKNWSSINIFDLNKIYLKATSKAAVIISSGVLSGKLKRIERNYFNKDYKYRKPGKYI